jgi:hypothetical protein
MREQVPKKTLEPVPTARQISFEFRMPLFHFGFLKVDSFKRSSEIKNHLRFEVDFLLFYAQNGRNLSETNG